ncbi:ATP-binding cassette domain-containing protein [Streptomyces iconiensis]|uniref:ATP-binding cassette domain-containing protein n=1 Tax=Streptomyces iconiensis TaxID=1384038 RepID=A0ABT6ZQV4_9ACTN|nr:ATP-binding cassette domain-containing protein [Streptomyces iconiensis]MDJ1131436.1 ATP-binding cassette domain-containing protein [Streptomyces iconiensis]
MTSEHTASAPLDRTAPATRRPAPRADGEAPPAPGDSTRPTAGDDAPAPGSIEATPPAAAITVRGLAKTYGTHKAVDGIDLTISPGEIFGFLGPNGAGKTTTIAMLCALTRPSAGRATVAGADVVTQPQQVRRHVGLLLQHTAVDGELTLQQNLYLHARLHQLSRVQARSRTTDVLTLTGLAARRGDRVRTLSGGMRRRLEIARSLLHQPRVLFLDEPSTGLDPNARAAIWRHLVQLRRQTGTTLYITTHYLDEAEHCDRAAIIDHGRIVAVGTPADLKAEIGDDRIHLRTADNAAAVSVLAQECGLPATGGRDGLTLRVADGARTVPLVCAALVARDITVHELSVTPPSLDDVFFHHTGRSIDTAAPEQP